jgi:hypothetical protein
LSIGDNSTKAIEAVWFELDRRLSQQARLVVLVNRMRCDLGCQHEVATRLHVQEVAVVGREPVVSSLPEVGSAVGIDTKALGRSVDVPVRAGADFQQRRELKDGLENDS